VSDPIRTSKLSCPLVFWERHAIRPPVVDRATGLLLVVAPVVARVTSVAAFSATGEWVVVSRLAHAEDRWILAAWVDAAVPAVAAWVDAAVPAVAAWGDAAQWVAGCWEVA
jgi:hypothetical protein